VPGDEKRNGPAITTEPPQLVPPTSTAILPDQGDPQRIGELVASWVGAKVEEVDGLVAEARSRVESLPDLRTLWLLVGEILVRLAAVEHEVAELRKAARR
jgi:hypothetical protein